MFKEIPRNLTDKRGYGRTKILGVGINDATYKCTYKINGVTYQCPYYRRWVGMLTRCYSKRWLKNNPSYEKCSVHPDWHLFSNFKKWMQSQEWKGKHLDKDILSLGKPLYSPETCMFISPQINSLFNTGQFSMKQGKLPVGIYFRNGKYEVGCSTGESKRKWVGSYPTINEAVDAYLSAKKLAMDKALQKESDPKVIQAVKNYFKYFTDTLEVLKTSY